MKAERFDDEDGDETDSGVAVVRVVRALDGPWTEHSRTSTMSASSFVLSRRTYEMLPAGDGELHRLASGLGRQPSGVTDNRAVEAI